MVRNIKVSKVIGDANTLNNAIYNDTTHRVTYSGNNTLKFIFQFEYYYEWVSSGIGQGNFTATTDKMDIEVNYLGDQNLDVNVYLTSLQIRNISIYGKYQGDTEVTRLAGVALNSFLPANVTNFNKALIQNVLGDDFSYYFAKKNAESLVSIRPSFLKNSSFAQVKLSSVKAPKFYSHGVVYYNSGHSVNSTYKNNNTVSWDNFTYSEAPTQFFLHQDVLSEMFSVYTDKGVASFVANSTNLPKNVSYSMSVRSLGDIIPDILRTRPADEGIFVNFSFDKFEFTASNDAFRANLLIRSNFVSSRDRSTVLSTLNEVSFNIKPKFVKNIVNLQLDASSIEFKKTSTDYKGIFNHLKLEQYFEQGLKTFLYLFPFNVFNFDVEIEQNNLVIRFIPNRGALLIFKKTKLQEVPEKRLKFLSE